MIGPDVRKGVSARIRPDVSKFAAWTGQAVCMYLMSRAQLLGGWPLFAPACFASGMSAGWNPAAMLIGCAAGALSSDSGEIGLSALISCLIACAFLFSSRQAEKKWPSAAEKRDFLCGAAAGCGMLAASMLLSGGMLYNMLTGALSSAVSMLMAPALRSGMGVKWKRKMLMPEEQLSLSLFLMIALIGLRAAPYAGRFASQAAAVLLALVFSGAGAGMGALAGLAAGTALTLGGSDPFAGSALGLCGLLAGCVRNVPRIGAAAAFAMGNTLTVSWGVGYTIGAAEVWPLLTGCVCYCLIPSGQISRLRGWMRGVYPHEEAENIAVRMRQKAGRKLSEISGIFGELADGYGEETALPGEQQIISQVRHALCDGCDDYAACWLGDHPAAGRLICRMAAEALSGKGITPARELPPDLLRHCRRSGRIDRRAMPLLTRLAKERRDALKRGEARSLMGRQFREAQRLLDSAATQMKGGICVNREYAPLVHAALDRAGIAARDITAVLDDRLEIICVLKDSIWDTQAARRAADLLTDELGVQFSPVLSRGQAAGECELRLRQAPALTAASAAVCCPAKEGEACGDSHIALLLPDGRFIAAISDGMGQGKRAAAESGKCVSLLRKFVSAGVERDAALNAVNSLLMLRDEGENFATADLCVVDLYSGVASWSKLGACRSFILSGRGVREIAGGRLPLGILDQVEPATEKTEVHPGDLLIMISDGVADELKQGQTEALKKEMLRIRHMNPAQAAGELIGWAKARDEGKERDDMTVIAARILARKIRVR